jgi:hypothetical protein
MAVWQVHVDSSLCVSSARNLFVVSLRIHSIGFEDQVNLLQFETRHKS